MFLLDTNVLSEMRKPAARASARVSRWVSSHHPTELCLSVVTILEVEWGIARLERRDPIQAARLTSWLVDEVLDEFRDRILAVTVPVARRTARLHVPDPRPERDAYIAATALVHGLTVAARSVGDFEPMGVSVVNPWGE